MLQSINWLAALIATLAGYLLGALWYRPEVFGSAWLAALGKRQEELGKPAMAMTVTAATTALTTICLAFLLRGLGVQSLLGGLTVGIVIGGGIVFATMVSDYLFQGKPMRLLWIQGGYRFAYILLICAILGAWP